MHFLLVAVLAEDLFFEAGNSPRRATHFLAARRMAGPAESGQRALL